MQVRKFLCSFAAVTVVTGAAACAVSAAGPDVAVPRADAFIPSSAEACPVTRPADPAFVPRKPYPAAPPRRGGFWFGTPSLWTVLPGDGAWSQLASGEKFWWWSEEFNVKEDETPDLAIRTRRLDGAAPLFRTTEATNGYHPDFHWAMLVGVTLPTYGCWEFTAEYRGHRLVVVQWAPQP